MRSPSATIPHRLGGSLSVGALGLACWAFAVSHAHFSSMGALGLITVLTWPYYVGLILIAVTFSFELLRTELRPRRLTILLMMLVVVLFATSSAIAPTPSLSDSYLHSGFISYILQHGHVLDNFDARFSWPGTFAFGALLVNFVGQSSAWDFLRWFPLVIELLYLAPLLAIARWSGVSRRAGYLGVAFFYTGNWIYQDYFSPQGLNFLFFLVVVALALALWKPLDSPQSRVAGLARRWRAARKTITLRRIEGLDSDSRWDRSTTAAGVALICILVAAAAISHQLTPYAMILALATLLIGRRLARPEILVFAVIATVCWLSVGATNYWIGHLSNIFGSFGNLNSTIGQNVGNRVTGNSTHIIIVDTRIGLTAVLFILAGVGVLRRATDDRAIELLAGVPFALLVVQSYGGEGLLRAALFSLPFTGLLAASAFLPRSTGTIAPWLRTPPLRILGPAAVKVAIALTLCLSAVAMTLVRGGNDAYESYSLGELAAVNYVYDHIHPRDSIGMVAPYLPIFQSDVGRVSYVIASTDGSSIKYDISTMLSARPNYVILSQSQNAWGQIVQGYPAGWQTQVSTALLKNFYKTVARWNTAVVYFAEP